MLYVNCVKAFLCFFICGSFFSQVAAKNLQQMESSRYAQFMRRMMNNQQAAKAKKIFRYREEEVSYKNLSCDPKAAYVVS